MRTSLFVFEEKERYEGSREMVRLAEVVCLWCGPVSIDKHTEIPLFRHGGYGEAVEWTIVSCRCGGVRSESHQAVNPRAFG